MMSLFQIHTAYLTQINSAEIYTIDFRRIEKKNLILLQIRTSFSSVDLISLLKYSFGIFQFPSVHQVIIN